MKPTKAKIKSGFVAANCAVYDRSDKVRMLAELLACACVVAETHLVVFAAVCVAWMVVDGHTLVVQLILEMKRKEEK